MVTLQETKLSSLSLHLLRSIGGARINEWVAFDFIGVLGGQLVGWNGKLFEKIREFSASFSISVKLKERATMIVFCITSMFGPSDRAFKPLLFQEIHIVRD